MPRTLNLVAVLGMIVALHVLARGESPAELLDRLAQKRAALRTVYHSTRTFDRDRKMVREITVETWESRTDELRGHRQFQKTTTTYIEDGHASDAKSLRVNDGRTQWSESRIGDTLYVIKGPADGLPPADGALKDLRQRLDRHRARIRDEETVDGRTCVVLEVAGEEGSVRFKDAYWLDLESGLVVQRSFSASDGRQQDVRTTQVRINDSIAGAVFTYTPPEGATVVDTDSFPVKGAATP